MSTLKQIILSGLGVPFFSFISAQPALSDSLTLSPSYQMVFGQVDSIGEHGVIFDVGCAGDYRLFPLERLEEVAFSGDCEAFRGFTGGDPYCGEDVGDGSFYVQRPNTIHVNFQVYEPWARVWADTRAGDIRIDRELGLLTFVDIDGEQKVQLPLRDTRLWVEDRWCDFPEDPDFGEFTVQR